jgi:phosphoenolpyruvate carboxykinase (ATP)
MPQHPRVYADLLADRLAASGARTFLINTGWIGGAAGTGNRIDIASTRRLVSAALSGELDGAEMRTDPNFGFKVPVSVPGVDSAILDPRETWANKAEYDATAARLVDLFVDNFAQFADDVDEGVLQAAPRTAEAA